MAASVKIGGAVYGWAQPLYLQVRKNVALSDPARNAS